MAKTLTELGYFEIPVIDKNTGENKISDNKYNRDKIEKYIEYKQQQLGITNLDEFFTKESLENSIANKDVKIKDLDELQKLIQIAVLLELQNEKIQSNSISEAQQFLNFDTKPYENSFDVYYRNNAYYNAVNGNSILSSESLESLKKNSLISPLDMGEDIKTILSSLFPLRNNENFNEFLLTKTTIEKNIFLNKNVISQDDEMKMVRIAKNDFLTYILQNNIDSSVEGMKFFHDTFETTKDYNTYMKELAETLKLVDMWNAVKSREGYDILVETYPFIENITIEKGENNNRLTTFSIIQDSRNLMEKESTINQFNELVNLPGEENKPIVDFFKNLALYSMFQSGLNTSENSYTNLVPIDIINKLYNFGGEEYQKNVKNKKEDYETFYKLFKINNSSFYNDPTLNIAKSPILDISSKGKWYSNSVPLNWKNTNQIPVGEKAVVKIYEGTVAAKNAARNREGIYAMRPNAGDQIPGVDENLHFGNPWSHAGYQGTIKTGSLSEAEATANGTWKGDVTSTAVSEAADNYEKWLKGEAFQDVEPERLAWIRKFIDAGRLDGKPFIYFKTGYRSHADVLVDFINNRNNIQPSTVIKPGVAELFDSNFLIFTESKTSDEVISKLLSNKIIDKKCN
jgi:hypothetical protein